MSQDSLATIQSAFTTGDQNQMFEVLFSELTARKEYPQLFEAMLLKRRSELGLPLVAPDSLDDLDDETRSEYEKSYLDAAREVGTLFLLDGDIERAWPYFRAIGDNKPVADALEEIEPGEDQDRLIEIAYYEQANPRKGFELILENYGTCNSITSFEQFPGREGRQESIELLVNRLHTDLSENLKAAVNQQEEGAIPEGAIPTIGELIANRSWLFEENNYHIDTSHLSAVVRFSIELGNPTMLQKAHDLTEYGRNLSEMFQFAGNPPFENTFADYGEFISGLLGNEGGIDHFKSKLEAADSDETRVATAQVLVELLSQFDRFDEAIAVSEQHLSDMMLTETQVFCPSLAQLCFQAGNPEKLKSLATEKQDFVSFAAAVLSSAK